jgi:hypothetical protein
MTRCLLNADMNKEYVLYNLKEALEQLTNTIQGLENNIEYDSPEFQVEMGHLYHHINTAWNAQNSTEQESIECSEDNFIFWRQFPNNEDLLLT